MRGVLLAGLAWAGAVAGVYGQGVAPTAVGPQFHVVTSGERTTLDRATGRLISTVDVRLLNLGGRTMTTPLHVVVDLEIEGTNTVAMPGALGGVGIGPHGTYYTDVSGQFPGGRITPNAEARTTLTFVRDRDTRFRYTPVPYATLVEPREPVLSLPATAFTVPEGGSLTFEARATDPDGEAVTLGAGPAVSNATFAATSGVTAVGTYFFEPTFDQAGVYALIFTATDPLGLTDQGTVLVTVSNVNRAPLLTGPSQATVAEGELLTLSFAVSDPDGEGLATSSSALPSNAVLVSDTATLYFAPDFTQAGVYPVDLRVSDGTATSAVHAVTITVTDVVQGSPGDTNALTLVVDPMPSPSLLAVQRVSGSINNTGATVRAAATMALITGLSPATAEQGQTQQVVLTGQGSGAFATHFGEGSVANFGAGVAVQSLAVSNASLAVATVAVAADAAPGARAVSVVTSNETAVSIVGFSVSAGDFTLSGTLIDADGSNAVAGAIITLQGTGYTTVSGVDGRFSFSGLPPGDYTLVINPPNHEPVTMAFTAVAGQELVLEPIPTTATVFDPAAPASVSLLSVLGRGLGSFQTKNLEHTKQTIRDALVLCGGTEAGVLDAYGNQLNPALTGLGLASLQDIGVRVMAERIDRGENVGLVDILLPFSFTFPWTGDGEPLTLQDWLDGLQAQVNAAWAAPQNPSNALAIAMFNHGPTLLRDPPQLSSMTRLNPAQEYLFVNSMLSTMIDPQGTNGLALRGVRAVGPPVTPSSAGDDRRWTSYWRGFSQQKNKFMDFQYSLAVNSFAAMSGVMMMGAAGGVRGTALVLPVVGLLGSEMTAALGNLYMTALVPEPPRLLYAELFPGPNRTPRVRINFRRSTSDSRDDRSFYALYRFRAPHEGRQLVTGNAFTNFAVVDGVTNIPQELSLVDMEPLPGATFYAVALARRYASDVEVDAGDINQAAPWWTSSTFGLFEPIAHMSRNQKVIMSDYSEPAVVSVEPGAMYSEPMDIELGQNGAVYLSKQRGTVDERVIERIEELGWGEVSVFAYPQFANPGQKGLAIDAGGNLYTANAASESLYGGRLFRFQYRTGEREFVGSINYYSRELFFAHPVSGGPLAIGPGASPGNSPEDLYVVDMLAGQLKRVPVQAAYDPYRRVGQPFSDIPTGSRPVDMEVSTRGTPYLLMSSTRPRAKFKDREKGSMHMPPGSPLKQRCPLDEQDKFVDPVYPFSGEFYLDAEDVRIRGVGLDFIWARKYRSKIGVDTVQGRNWDYSYNVYITTNDDRTIDVHDGNTRADTYTPSGTNNLWTCPEFFRELVRNGDGTYALEFEDKGRWVFNGFTGSAADGRLQQSIDRHGNTLTFFYGGGSPARLEMVRDTLNRDIHIGYNAQGRVDAVVDFTGRMWRYLYYGPGESGGSEGDLKAFILPAVTNTPNGNDFPDGRRVTYTYTTGHADERLNGNLATITDGRRNDPRDPTYGLGPYLVNEYAATTNDTDLDFDRIVRQRWGDPGDTIEMAYAEVNPTDENGGSVVKTIFNDRNGNVKEYFYDEANRCTIKREYTGRAAPGLFTTETQNRPANKLRIHDPDYFETRYEWNGEGLKRREYHPNGNITEWVYEADLDPNAPSRTRANVREIRHLPGTHVPAGDQTSIVERFEYDTSYGRGCCGFNFVTQHTDGRGNVEFKAYDGDGNLTQIVHRVSSIREEFAYDSRGRMVRQVYPDNGNGHRRVDRHVYYGPSDGAQNGFLKELIVDDGGLNLTTRYQYDRVGNVVALTDPRGKTQQFIFNQNDEVMRQFSAEVSDGSGLRYVKDYHMDANGNLVRTETENRDETGALVAANPWFTISSEFDILNLAVRTTTEIEPGRSLVTETRFDRNRNPIVTRSGVAVNGSQPGNTVVTRYDERDLVFQVVQASGTPDQATEQRDYDGNGNLVRTQQALEDTPRATEVVYDGYNRQVRAVDAMGNETTWTYDAGNMPQTVRLWGELVDGPEGGTNNVLQSEQRTAYDAMNRVLRVEQAHFVAGAQSNLLDGVLTGIQEYNGLGQMTRTWDDRGNAQVQVYDRVGRLVQRIDAQSNTVVRTYDANSKLVTLTETERSDLGGPAQVFVLSNRYDNLSRLVEAVDSAGNTTRYAYDSRHNALRVTDAQGNVTRSELDGLGRLTRSVRLLTSTGTGAGAPAGQITMQQTWDDACRLATRTDDTGQTTTYRYDNRDRVVAIRHADGTTNSTAYDVHGNLVRSVDANGTVCVRTFDLLNRVTRMDIAPASGISTATTVEVYAYDGLGRIVRAADNDSVVERAYDSLSRKLSETVNGQMTQLSYDGAGNTTRIGYPGGRFAAFTYDSLNNRRTVADDGGVVAAYSYAGPTRVVRRTARNGTQLDVTYDTARRVTRTAYVRDPLGSPATIDDRRYAWDAMYNKTLRTNLVNGAAQRFSYDSVYRMTQTVASAGGAMAYTLDGAGNRQAVTGPVDAGVYTRSAATPEPADAALHQYTSTPFDTRRYDANGNLTSINLGQPGEKRMTYDYRNHMVEFVDVAAGVTAQYAYDAMGRRLSRALTGGPTPGTTRYVYDGGDRVIEERDAANAVTATYVYGNYVDEVLAMRRGGVDYYYHQDDLYNVTKLTDAAGAIVEQYEYADFGRPDIRTGAGVPLAWSAVGNPYLFNGRNYDPESGWYFYRSRYLDSRAGRFTTRDAIGIWGDPQNQGNGYTFAGNNPWRNLDPMGYAALAALGFGSGIGQSGINVVAAFPQLLVALASDAPGFLSAMCQLGQTMVAGDSEGFFKMTCPDIYRGLMCWEYLDEFERGFVVGRMVGVFGEAIAGGVGACKGGRAAMAALKRRGGGGGVPLPGGDPMAMGNVLDQPLNPALEKFKSMTPTKENMAAVFEALEHPEARHMAYVLRNDVIPVDWVGQILTKEGIGCFGQFTLDATVELSRAKCQNALAAAYVFAHEGAAHYADVLKHNIPRGTKLFEYRGHMKPYELGFHDAAVTHADFHATILNTLDDTSGAYHAKPDGGLTKLMSDHAANGGSTPWTAVMEHTQKTW